MLPGPKFPFLHEAPALQRRNQHRIRPVGSRRLNEKTQIIDKGGMRIRITLRIFLLLVIVPELDKQKISFPNLLLNDRKSPLINKAFSTASVYSMIGDAVTCLEKYGKYLPYPILRVESPAQYIVCILSPICAL